MLVLLLALCAQVDDPAADPQPSPPPVEKAEPKREDPFFGKSEADALDALRALEARRSAGQPLTPGEVARLRNALKFSAYPSVRALAAAVLAWVEPAGALSPLLAAFKDPESRVRATAAQSVLSLSRQLNDDERRRAVTETLILLDDQSDEVACTASELLVALAPSAAADAVRTRAHSVSDVRYACFSRGGGLPIRPVNVPPLPESKPAEKPKEDPLETPTPSPVAPAPPPRDGRWIFVATAAGAGLLSGGLSPSILVPSRDVLLYRDETTRITREEVSGATQAGAGLLVGGLLGGGAWALNELVGPLNVDEAGSVALGTGALALAGASAQLFLPLKEGPAAGALAGGTLLGVAGATGLAYALELDADDNVLALTAFTLGAFGGTLAAFTATPVNSTEVGGALRTDFGLGIGLLSAGALGFGALSAGGFVDVPAARSMAALGGGLLLGGLGLGAGFVFVPRNDVQSRIACGVGLAGVVVGTAAGAFLIPDAWLPIE